MVPAHGVLRPCIISNTPCLKLDSLNGLSFPKNLPGIYESAALYKFLNGTRVRSVVAKSKTITLPFSVKTFLATENGGRTISTYRTKQKIYSQGDAADSVFYIREGNVKI